MGAFDGAECCELIGLFILKDLANLEIDVGIYRDDGLCVCNKKANLQNFQSEQVRNNN